MSAPVDVLTVLDDHMRVHGRNGCPQHQRELLVVRNAVAELIEAAEETQADAFILGMEIPRLVASLARVKGGAE
jgi:hypothetical protein